MNFVTISNTRNYLSTISDRNVADKHIVLKGAFFLLIFRKRRELASTPLERSGQFASSVPKNCSQILLLLLLLLLCYERLPLRLPQLISLIKPGPIDDHSRISRHISVAAIGTSRHETIKLHRATRRGNSSASQLVRKARMIIIKTTRKQ